MSDTVGRLVNYTVSPTLEHITLIKVASLLWSHADVRDLILKYFSVTKENRKGWQEIEDEVAKQVKEFILPKCLTENLIRIIEPVGLQIHAWIEIHSDSCHLKIPDEFHWTPQGTIDRKKTAQELIKMDDFCIYRRYELACRYCLEDDIFALSAVLKKHKESSCEEVMKESIFVSLWSDCDEVKPLHQSLIEEGYESNVSYEFEFQCAITRGNEVATRFFFDKLTAEEKRSILVSCAGYVARSCALQSVGRIPEHYTNVLCFLLTVMNRDQQVEVLQYHSYGVLKSLLKWPWQSFFIETACRTWTYLSEDDSCNILNDIYDNVGRYKHFNYKKLFGSFWRTMSTSQKKHAVCYWSRLLLKLFQNKDRENIKLILNYAALCGVRILLTIAGEEICWHLFRNDEWDLFKFLLQDCGQCTSLTDVMLLKDEFRIHFAFYCPEEKWDKFIEVVDEVAKVMKE